MCDLRGDPESMYCDLCKQMKGTDPNCLTASGNLKWVCTNVNCDRYLDKYIEEYFSKKAQKRPYKGIRIIEVQEVTCLDIEIEEGNTEYYYRRQSEEVWDRQHGQSWESVSYPENLETAYQEWLKDK